MTVAVVIPCRNEAAHVGPLLEALAAQTAAPGEVVIVDDRSTDATLERIQQWQSRHATPLVRVVSGRGLGPGPAMNDGIRATHADIIVRFDAHALPAPDYLERCLDTLGFEGLAGGRSFSSGKTGVVGGVWKVAPGAETAVARAIAAVVSHPFGSGGALYRHAAAGGSDRTSVETVPFGTFRRSLWEQLGGFDEALVANEDFDFNYRARKSGVDVVLDRRITATYFARPTLGALRRQYFRYGFWKQQMLRKDPRAVHWRQIPPTLVLPWVVMTLAWVITMPSLMSGIAVALYPVIVIAAGLHIALTRKVSPFAAAAALATVHLAWSAGFAKGCVVRCA